MGYIQGNKTSKSNPILKKGQLLFIILSSLFLSSCSPVYKIAYDLKPPTTAKGLTCIKGCQKQLQRCDQQCGLRFKQCSIKQEQQAKKLLPGLQHEYPQKMQAWQAARLRYERDLDWYEFRRDMAEARHERYIDSCISKDKKRSSCYSHYAYDPFPYNRPNFDLPRPVRPTLASVSAKLRGLRCSQECGCKSKYRLCYTSCGGSVKSNKVCIKNCVK